MFPDLLASWPPVPIEVQEGHGSGRARTDAGSIERLILGKRRLPPRTYNPQGLLG